MSKELITTGGIDWANEKMIATLKATVAQGATNEEFAMFAELCKATGLNPFKREIWFIKDKQGRVTIMAGVQGFYGIANGRPEFDGIETEIIEANGKLLKAVARVYRKDRSRPMVAEAYYSEYAKSYGNWQAMPRVMLSKCAESMALRKSFPQQMNGVYTQEEMPPEFGANAVDITPKTPAQRADEAAAKFGLDSRAERAKAAGIEPAERVRVGAPIPQAPKEDLYYKARPPMTDEDIDKFNKKMGDAGAEWCDELIAWKATDAFRATKLSKAQKLKPISFTYAELMEIEKQNKEIAEDTADDLPEQF